MKSMLGHDCVKRIAAQITSNSGALMVYSRPPRTEKVPCALEVLDISSTCI